MNKTILNLNGIMTECKVGDTLIIREGGYAGTTRKSVVKRITPKGSVRAESGTLFDTNGYAKTSDLWHSLWIVQVIPKQN